MSRSTIVGAPTSAGAYAPGQEEGPRALFDVDLVHYLDAPLAEKTADGSTARRLVEVLAHALS